MSESSLFSPPRLVIALGIYRSASTWAANIMVELLRRQGRTSLAVADSVADLVTQVSGGTIVVKTHQPDASLRLLIHVARLPAILTVREPADCVASLIEQFKEGFDTAAGAVAASCREIVGTLPFFSPFVLRYEAAEARGPDTVLRLASHLGIAITDGEAEALAARYAPSEVRKTIDSLTQAGAFGEDPQPHHVDKATQWHPGHLGSGLSGRQHDVLTPAQIALVESTTRSFRETFGYAARETHSDDGRR